ncbi:MAG TPA: acyl-CoA dehydrogenase family protein [Kofleriaceae bacterium]|nr:acyl-CoA dehydrogenase family protein [Kofleriaceae bacterium]
MTTEIHELPEVAEFRREVRAWIAANRPAPPGFVLPQSFLEVETREQLEYLRAWQNALHRAGLLGFDVPREYGGQGVSPERAAVVGQELVRVRAPFMVNLLGLRWAGPTILTYGTEEQKRRLLPPLLAADEIWCQGFSEPGAGSDLASLTTRAEPDGAGGWRVTGHKVWTTLAHFADWMILLARTGPAKYEGLSYFLFPMRSPGVRVEPLVKMTAEGGFNQVVFDGAPMPRSALLGQEGQGWRIAMTTLAFERGGDGQARERGADDLALILRVAELAARARRDGAPALDDPVLADQLVALWIEAEAIGLSALRARAPGLVADRPLALPLMHKLVFSELAQRATRLACQLLGSEATLWMGDARAPDGGDWPRAHLNSYGFTIGGGTSEVQRNILGERVLGLPKSK